MTFAIHKRYNISMAKIRDKTNVGLEPAYQQKYEGKELFKSPNGTYTGLARYAKNIARMKGLCKTCEHYVPENVKTVDGSHCERKVCAK
ncbi:MAG: hypothetical protein MUO31_13085 [Thermodesulfovibrionales bacterium]|nr:hypothetical protein [Thermodesulfovibrionales bacterium]